MDFKPLKYIFIPSEKPEATTLLLLHGTGGDENDLIPLARHFGNGFHILSVRGNVSENGMPRFFKRLGMGIFDEEDVVFRTHELADFLKRVSEKENFDASKIVALGYSNGANIAGALNILYPDFLAGAILLRPMQPLSNPPAFESKKGQPVFMSSGNYDPTVKAADTLNYENLLKSAGYHLTSYHLNSGHNLVQEDIRFAVDWYQENFG